MRLGNVLVATLALAACTSPSFEQVRVPTAAFEVVRPSLSLDAPVSMGEGALAYFGFSLASSGSEVRLTHYFKANRVLPAGYRIFVHYLVQGARGWIPNGDHVPAVDTGAWVPGHVVRDVHSVSLPSSVPSDHVALWVGMYRGTERMTVDDVHAHDGSNRIFAGVVPAPGRAHPVPVLRAQMIRDAVDVDGRLSEDFWSDAAAIHTFVRTHDARPHAVHLRLAVGWDAEHLVLGWETDDADVQAHFTQRDDPLYQEEAFEVYLDMDCDRMDYTEIQLSPAGVLFDARFSGGARRNMDLGYNAKVEHAATIHGTANNREDRDTGWSGELRIATASLPDGGPLAAGNIVCANFFSVARDGASGLMKRSETAWSAPLMGDFHNLARFGHLWLTR